MNVQHFYDSETGTLTYLVYDRNSKDTIIIDPVLDFDLTTGEVFDHSFKQVQDFIKEHGLNPKMCLETHVHADHLSSSQLLKKYYPNIQITISERISAVQKTFKELFELNDFRDVRGEQFDRLIKDDEEFNVGSIHVRSIPTPGHTPACTSYVINNMVFVGDTLFVEDAGTGRCDFPNGSAEELYQSIHRLYELSEDTIVFVGHDYRPNERELRFETTIGKSKRENAHVKSTTTKEEYVKFRTARDKTLKAPRLLIPSIQVNMNAGILPRAIKLPIVNKI